MSDRVRLVWCWLFGHDWQERRSETVRGLTGLRCRRCNEHQGWL